MNGPRPSIIHATLAVYIICFSVGIMSHARDFLRFGWRPYQWGSTPLEIFWTSLIILDAAALGLLLAGRRRAGLIAALTIMTLDVAANGYALFAMRIEAFAGPLVMQTAFFGFVLGSIAFLWPKPESP